MRDTTMTVQRNKATIRTGLPVQIQNMAWKEALDMGRGSPYDSFWIRTTGGGTVDIRRGDLLIDEGETDPLTNTATHYRVFGNPNVFYQTFTKIPAEKIVGT